MLVKKSRQYSLPLISMWLTVESALADHRVIAWHTYHRPPTMIKHGDLVDKGFIDQVTNLIIEKLPQYRHEKPLTSPARTLSELASGKQACHPSLYKNKERQKFIYFSKPNIISPSIRMVSKQTPKQQTHSTINLSTHKFAQTDTFVVNKDRSYGSLIDDFLTQMPTQRKMLLSTSESETLLKMISNERINYAFFYPFEVNYFISQNQGSQLRLWHVELVPQFIYGYVGCAKTEWGKQVIALIDQALADLVHTDGYFEAMTYWWQSEAQEPEFRSFYQERFLQLHQKDK